MKKIYLAFAAIVLLLGLDGCRSYDNFTTYFNTYYNAKRLLGEAEDEFEFSDRQRRMIPRVVVPLDSGVAFGGKPSTNELAPYMKDYIIDKARVQPVATKLDSILIKGSKILKRHPQSNYIEGSLFLMAKSYFYRNEWMNSELKCSELIDLFPLGDLSPDAHLLLAQSYIIERKYTLGKQALSRTIDIAWYKERYDILSQAFKFIAEQALFENDVEAATRPYRQAVATTDDEDLKAKWRIELGSIFYRQSLWKAAEEEFAQVGAFSIDLLGEFESRLLRASSLIHLKKFEDAENILSSMMKNENYKDWEGYILAEQMRMFRLSGKDSLFESSEKKADGFSGQPSIAAVYFERAIEYYKKNDFVKSRIYFAKARGPKSPIQRAANEYYNLLNEIEQNKNHIIKKIYVAQKDSTALTDTGRAEIAAHYYSVGRAFEKLGRKDSALSFYHDAVKNCPSSQQEKAQFLYAVYRFNVDSNPEYADSLLETIALEYSATPFGSEARKILGFNELAIVDTVGDLYMSGSRFRMVGSNEIALKQFKMIFSQFPDSPFAPRALYAVGWIFERRLHQLDSARHYYLMLKTKYPNTSYAMDILPALAFMDSKNAAMRDTSANNPGGTPLKGIPVQDSLVTPPPADSNLSSQSETRTITVPSDTQGKSSSPFPINLPSSLNDVFKADIKPKVPGVLESVFGEQDSTLVEKPTQDPPKKPK